MRLVFDTQYFKRLLEPELAELCRRGFVLSVSSSAFVETWRQARRDRKPGLFYKPARRFGPFVDPGYPIAAQTGTLFARLGAPPRQGGTSAARALEVTLLLWKHALTSNAEDPFYRKGGEAARAHVLSERRDWLKLAKPWTTKRDGRISDKKHQQFLSLVTGADPRRLQKAMFRVVRDAITPPGMAPTFTSERFDAYIRVTSSYLLAAGRRAQQPTGNDAQDVMQLTHVGEPAIFVTHERKILGLVDRSGTFQAPWVRSLAEVLSERLPRGTSWGRHARGVASSFRRRPYAELHDLEKVILARIRAGSQN